MILCLSVLIQAYKAILLALYPTDHVNHKNIIETLKSCAILRIVVHIKTERMKIKTDEFIILRLPPNEENTAFICSTFEITQYLFFDDRLPTSQIIKENIEEFNIEYYQKFLEKYKKTEETEIIFNINEFLYLAHIIDFVAKYFIGAPPKGKLEKIITSDLENEDFDFKEFKKWYWTKSTNLFQEFRDSCKNEKLLKSFNEALNF